MEISAGSVQQLKQNFPLALIVCVFQCYPVISTIFSCLVFSQQGLVYRTLSPQVVYAPAQSWCGRNCLVCSNTGRLPQVKSVIPKGISRLLECKRYD